MTRTKLEEVCFTEVMTEVRGSKRSGLDTGEAADGRSDAPMDMAMQMAMAVTSIAVVTAGEDTLEPIERNENGKRTRRSEVPVTAWALGDRRRRMEHAAQQQARELAQLHRTITKMANMLETQWRGMKTWLEEKEEKRDAYHQDDVLWGKDITEMVARVVAATERDQREKRKADTESVGLEASIHAELVLATGPGNPPAVRVLTGGSVRFGSKPGQKPDPLCLGGFVTRTGHKPAVFWPGCTWTAVPFCGSSNFRSN